MSKKKIFPVMVSVLVLALIAAACGPKPPVEPASPPSIEEPSLPTVGDSGQETPDTVSQGDCYNAFNPVVEGKVWQYNLDSGGETESLNISYKDVTNSSFTSVQQFSDTTTEIQWTCSPEGLISSQFANMAMAQIPDITIETLEVKGVVFPKESLWQVGYSWTTEYLIRVEYTSGDTSLAGEGNITLVNTITAIEPVTVRAGTFNEAVRVDGAGSFDIKVMGIGNTIAVDFSNWYVRDIGMVKSASTDDTLKYSMELTAFD